MRRIILAAIASVAIGGILPSSVQAAAVVSGSAPGPDSSFSTQFSFLNDVSSTLDVLGLTLDGAFATPQVLVWDTAFDVWAPSGGTATKSGEDTSLLSFAFTGWNPGKVFSFAVDPDTVGDPSFGATVLDMLGTRVTFTFSDSSTATYQFVDDPAPGAGLVLAAVGGAIPEPFTWGLMIVGFAAVGSAMRRNRQLRLSGATFA